MLVSMVPESGLYGCSLAEKHKAAFWGDGFPCPSFLRLGKCRNPLLIIYLQDCLAVEGKALGFLEVKPIDGKQTFNYSVSFLWSDESCIYISSTNAPSTV